MPYNTVICVTTTLILFALSCLALTLRFFNRFFLIHDVAVDDYLAALATVRVPQPSVFYHDTKREIEAAYTVVAIMYTVGLLYYGIGKQTSEVDLENYVVGVKVRVVGLTSVQAVLLTLKKSSSSSVNYYIASPPT
ncbi:uncharacterized protein BJX67DRAFT_380935 [Aspergillus lucknowensis]|uniref:Uncharacterized protein n=1 Tax=Aspergillus lucknowensis TaxID=176173 RepID=A0ABR4LT74_9EURO